MAKNFKQKIRQEYLKKLKGLTSKQKALWDESIFQQFISSKYFFEARTIALYYSLPYEVDTLKLIKFLLENKKKVALPRMVAKNLVFYYIKSLADVVVDNQWNLHQPRETSQIVKVTDLDLIILPLVGFNQKRYRLGHGQGYYDRFLISDNLKATKLVLAYQMQEIPLNVFFVDNWDVPFDALITNK